MTQRLGIFLIVSVVLATAGISNGGATPKLPAQVEPLKDTVDHWGLALSDQLREYDKHFAKSADGNVPDFLLGVETPLRKTFKNKYWFKGKFTDAVELAAGRNEWEQFQLAVLPKTGETLKDVRVTASALTSADGKASIPASAVRLWRVGFVKTATPQYPVRHVGEWPDPLYPLEPFSIDGTDLGLVWCEIHVPKGAAPGEYTGTITVTPANAKPATLKVTLRVWNFTLPDRAAMPMMVWTKNKPGQEDFPAVAEMFLAHHMDPIDIGNTCDPKVLEENLKFGFERGLMAFNTPRLNSLKERDKFRSCYELLKKKGWLDKALVYSNHDEPLEEQLPKKNIPHYQAIHKEFPGLRVFLASQYYPKLDQATDVWICDLSTNYHSWRNAGKPGKQQSWWYFCHLPIRMNYEQPLVNAPNMLIDNDAIEHRLAYWMADRYDVKGMFLWAGNRGWPKDLEKWTADGFPCTDKNAGFPYGGIHNGNGYLIYPGPLPSVRLKVLRDSAEDYAYLQHVAQIAQSDAPSAKAARTLLKGIVPTLFVDTHYFNRDPEALLEYRTKLGEFLDRNAAPVKK